jgi:hypothetical protein
VLRDVGVNLGGSCTKLETVHILTKPIGLADEFYGNIGESTLSSFASFTLDFNTMHFETNTKIRRDCSVSSNNTQPSCFHPKGESHV